MSGTKFTPGPWRVGQLVSYDGVSGAPFRCVYRSDQETALTRIYVWGADRAGETDVAFDCDADAKLIAAAPALYDALANVNKLISEGAATGFNWQDGDWAERLFHSQQDTSKALALARANPGEKS